MPLTPRGIWIALPLLALLLTGPGCYQPLTRWRMARDTGIAKGISREELGPDDRTLLARWLAPKASAHSGDEVPPGLVMGPNGFEPAKVVPNPEAEKEFATADALFKKGSFREAESAFRAIAKQRQDTPWGEKGQFYLAECLYQRGNFVGAHDAYEELFKTYPGTKFLEKALDREYQIAQSWLGTDAPKKAQNSKGAVASTKTKGPGQDPAAPADLGPEGPLAAKPEGAKAEPDETDSGGLPWNSRLIGRLPLVDSGGNALQVLEHVRIHDPNGPLSEKAAMQIADHHMMVKDYEVAAIYYDQISSDHSKSPLVQSAQLKAIDARMKAYLGPEYDGQLLQEAKEKIVQTKAEFPERLAGTDDLTHKLDLIRDAQAERDYKVGEYYFRINQVPSAEYYFGKVVQRWPKTEWEAKARTRLAKLAKMPRKESLPSKILTQPGREDGNGASAMGAMGGSRGAGSSMGGMGGMPGMGGMGGMGMM